jgi:hypothetical protein
MGQRERFVVFLVGAMMGVGILLAGRSCGHEKQDQLRRVRTALNLPPMMYDYAVMHKGFYGHYVLYSNVTQTPTAQVREVVTGGTRRYDANGRELPEEYLWITETYDLGVPLAEAGPVKSYSFAYADRFLVTMKAGHDIFEAGILGGEEHQPVSGHPGQYLLFYTKAGCPASTTKDDIDVSVWASAKSRLQTLQNSPAVESAQWVKIDWEAEADLIRANTGKTR